jgi:hypothetical protein
VPVMRDRPVDVHHEREALKDDEAARWLCEHDPVVIAAERRRLRREQRRERWLKQQRRKEILSARPPLALMGPLGLNAMTAWDGDLAALNFFRYLR